MLQEQHKVIEAYGSTIEAQTIKIDKLVGELAAEAKQVQPPCRPEQPQCSDHTRRSRLISRSALFKVAAVGAVAASSAELLGAPTVALAETKDSNFVAAGPSPLSGIGFSAELAGFDGQPGFVSGVSAWGSYRGLYGRGTT